MIKHDFINQLYQRPLMDAPTLWYELSREYLRLSTFRFHGIKPYPLAGFIQQHCTRAPDDLNETEKFGFMAKLMAMVSKRMSVLKLADIKSFVKLIRLFLSCYPVYLSSFTEDQQKELQVVPFALPLSNNVISQMMDIAANLLSHYQDSNHWSWRDDFVHFMEGQILGAEPLSYQYIKAEAFLGLATCSHEITPKDDWLIKRIQLLRDEEEYDKNQIILIEYIKSCGQTFSKQVSNYLMHLLTSFTLTERKTIKRLKLLGDFYHIFPDPMKPDIINFIKNHITSHQNEIGETATQSAVEYVNTILQMKLENFFIDNCLKLLTGKYWQKIAAINLLKKLYTLVDDKLKQQIIEGYILALSQIKINDADTLIAALNNCHELITPAQTDVVIDFIIKKIIAGSSEWSKTLNSTTISSPDDTRFDLVHYLQPKISADRKTALGTILIAKLFKPYKKIDDKELAERADSLKGGLLYSTFKFYPILSHQQKLIIKAGLLYQLANPYQLQYMRDIVNYLQRLKIIETNDDLKNLLPVIIKTINKLLWAEWTHHYFTPFNLLNIFYNSASEELKANIITCYHTSIIQLPGWMINSINAESGVILKNYLTTRNFTTAQYADEFIKDDYDKKIATAKVAENNDPEAYYQEDIRNLYNDKAIFSPLRNLIQNLKNMSSKTMKLLIDTILTRLSNENFIKQFAFERTYEGIYLFKLFDYMNDDEKIKFKTCCINHLQIDNGEIFSYACFMIFKVIKDLDDCELKQIVSFITVKLNHENKLIREYACILLTHLMTQASSDQHQLIMSSALHNLTLKPEKDEQKFLRDRTKNLMYTLLSQVAKFGSTAIRIQILNHMMTCLAKTEDHDIARNAILALVPSLHDNEANYLFYGLIANKLEKINTQPTMQAYFFDLYVIMVEGIKLRQNKLSVLTNLKTHLIPDVADIVFSYQM